jgi:hypothetical protein
MFRPPVILAVDPGAKCGVVVLVHGRPVLVRTVRGDLIGEVLAVIQAVVKLQETHGMAVVVVELQFMGRGSKSNPKSMATLYKRRHLWEILAEVYGLMVEGVYPATWQTVLGEVESWDDAGKKRDTKAKARVYADRRYPGKAKDNEQSDALCMGHWRWRRAA